ncbi:hypothetical protein F5Y12DRAFT_756380 [Xylaria sp. FL1777]|nr:hypothetical protein F5Y12DRAFT_756380 [Xylaria sp. FL1777]
MAMRRGCWAVGLFRIEGQVCVKAASQYTHCSYRRRTRSVQCVMRNARRSKALCATEELTRARWNPTQARGFPKLRRDERRGQKTENTRPETENRNQKALRIQLGEVEDLRTVRAREMRDHDVGVDVGGQGWPVGRLGVSAAKKQQRQRPRQHYMVSERRSRSRSRNEAGG